MGTLRSRRTDPGHRQLLAHIEALAGHAPIVPQGPDPGNANASSGRPYYGLSVPDQRRMVRGWLADHRTWTPEQVLRTVNGLLASPSYEEKTCGCMIIKERQGARRLVAPTQVEAWLDDIRGWAEVDSLCQSMFRG